MDKAVVWLIDHRKTIYIIFLILLALSLLLIPLVEVNYDLAHYLPKEAKTKQAIEALEKGFGYPGTVEVMVSDISLSEALAIKQEILSIEGVKGVTWLDDLTDIYQPQSFIAPELLEQYYSDSSALYQVEFSDTNYSLNATAAVKSIRKQIGGNVSIAGPAEDTRFLQSALNSEILQIMLVVVPLCIVVLLLASQSWIEPLLYLIVIGSSIFINMGTNVIFPNISFITHSVAAVLQLAMAMDYSLFICHRYTEERKNGLEPQQAILTATKQSLSSISASSTTTIAGFLALIFMQYSIGADMGLVLAKGILISYLTVLILMPPLLYSFRNLLEKSKHRSFLPSFKKMGPLTVKLRYLIIALVILVTVPSFLAQQNNTYLYGDTSGSSADSEYAIEREQIEERFGVSNPVVLLVPNEDVNREITLCDDLNASPYVKGVIGLVTVADPAIPREFLPQEVRDNFLSEEYSRIIVNLATPGETPQTFEAVKFLNDTLQKHYPDRWLTAGTATSVADIKTTVESDNLVVSLFSLAAVGIIIFLTFRSISLPIILVAVIQIAIWINMGIPYFAGSSLVFIGYLIIKSLQLGATIDYAILLTNRYMSFRQDHKPKEAAALALQTAGGSVLTSASILSLAGFTVGLISQIDAVSTIGMLLGRGAALSGILVLSLLPVLLIVFDKLIMVTTLGTKNIRKQKEALS